jgi:uncharacterized protein (TIGR02646 family)
MIHVNRIGPRTYFLKYAAQAEGEAEQNYSRNSPDISLVMSVTDDKFKRIRGRVLADLAADFHGKCAYCETSIGPGGYGVVDFFRPRRGVSESRGSYLPTHYWRLAFEWRNLYYACAICNRNKRDYFPVAGNRAPPDASSNQVQAETPLLIDPCADDPSSHLLFAEDGLVFGLTDRGKTTIKLLGLNREALVLERQKAVQHVLAASGPLRQRMLEETEPYLAAKLEALSRQQRDSPGARERAQSESVLRREQAEHTESAPVATNKGEGLDAYEEVARYVESVSLTNIGPFVNLKLELGAVDQAGMPCFALLGINGVGKSTVLRAIALALGGKPYANKLGIRSDDLLAPNSDVGAVKVRVSGYDFDIAFTAVRGKRLAFYKVDSSCLVLAYGSTRLLATAKRKTKPGMLHAKIDNLFDPFLPVSDPTSWLASIGQGKHGDVTRTLNLLLADASSTFLVASSDLENGVVFQTTDNLPLAVERLSDGYKSLLGIATDIMQVMYAAGYASTLQAQGVVLIDELGNHFHPSWKMRIVTSLRRAFPKIQFIFSTHEPLCLRGLGTEEVAVLKRDEAGRAYAVTQLPDVSTLRVDQLLTSEHFGLGTTLDPKLDDETAEYSRLAQKPIRTEEDGARFKELQETLSAVNYLGSSRRERILLMLIDSLEKEAPDIATGTVNAKALSENTFGLLKRVLEQLKA